MPHNEEEEDEPLTLAGRRADGEHVAVEPRASLLLAEVPAFARTPGVKLALLAGACAMEATCYTLCVPFLTTHLNNTYDISIAEAGFIFVSYTIGSVCSTPLVETITRNLGSSGAISAAVCVLGLSQLVLMFARTIPALLSARFVGGLAAGLIWSAVLTSCHLMSHRSGNMGTLFGTVLGAVSMGTVIGPALGGTMYRYGGWHLPLGVVAVVCLVFSLLIALLLPEESVTSKEAHAAAGSGWGALASRQLIAVLAIVMSGATVFSSIDSVLPIHLQRQYGHTSLQTAGVFLVISIFYGLAAPTFGSIADRTGKALYVSMGGLLGLALLLPLWALPLPQWGLFVVAVLFGTCATAQLTPASTLLEQVAAEVVGDHPTLTYAVFNCAYVSGMALGPGTLAMLTDLLSFQLATVCVAGGALVVSGVAACSLHSAMHADTVAQARAAA